MEYLPEAVGDGAAGCRAVTLTETVTPASPAPLNWTRAGHGQGLGDWKAGATPSRQQQREEGTASPSQEL